MSHIHKEAIQRLELCQVLGCYGGKCVVSVSFEQFHSPRKVREHNALPESDRLTDNQRRKLVAERKVEEATKRFFSEQKIKNLPKKKNKWRPNQNKLNRQHY